MASFKYEHRTGEGPAKCTWQVGADLSKSPHHHVQLCVRRREGRRPSSVPLTPPPGLLPFPAGSPRTPKPKTMGSILENVGNTPMVRLNKLPQAEGLQCEVCTEPRPRAVPSSGGPAFS